MQMTKVGRSLAGLITSARGVRRAAQGEQMGGGSEVEIEREERIVKGNQRARTTGEHFSGNS